MCFVTSGEIDFRRCLQWLLALSIFEVGQKTLDLDVVAFLGLQKGGGVQLRCQARQDVFLIPSHLRWQLAQCDLFNVEWYYFILFPMFRYMFIEQTEMSGSWTQRQHSGPKKVTFKNNGTLRELLILELAPLAFAWAQVQCGPRSMRERQCLGLGSGFVREARGMLGAIRCFQQVTTVAQYNSNLYASCSVVLRQSESDQFWTFWESPLWSHGM